MDIKQLSWKGDEWIHLAQGTDKWWTLVNAVMNIQFHKILEIS